MRKTIELIFCDDCKKGIKNNIKFGTCMMCGKDICVYCAYTLIERIKLDRKTIDKICKGCYRLLKKTKEEEENDI